LNLSPLRGACQVHDEATAKNPRFKRLSAANKL
jgi:hypothetical protein